MSSQPNSDSRPGGSGWLLCLLLATFAIGTDDFVIAGVLPAISTDLGVTEAAAGQLVTVFSVTYALAAVPLAVVTARLPRKTLIVVGLSGFALANLVTALAPNYALLMAMRVLAALIAAMITPAAFSMAAQAAAPGRAGRAIGTVAAGLTVSLVVGVPIGTVLGDTFGWRSTFVAVGLCSALVAAASSRALPRIPGAPEAGVAEQLRTLGRPAVLLCVVGTILGAGSGLMVYTYIAPITQDLTGQGGPLLAMFIGVVGVAGAIGTFAGGRLTDRWGADRTLLVTFSGLLAGIAVLAALGATGSGDVPIWLTVAVLAGWGFAAWGFNPPMNARIMLLAGDAETEAVALNTSGLYVGITIAGAVGGWALADGGGAAVTVASLCIGAVAWVVMALSVRSHPTKIPAPESPTPVG